MGSLRLLALVVLIGCGGGDDGAGPDAGGDPDAAPEDPTDALFDPDHILEVSITLDAADWAQLRDEPDEIGLPHTTCDAVATVEPYTQFHADITIDGETYEDVALRKKGGFGSISSVKPGLRVKAAEYVPSQRIFGLKNLTLNNNIQDETLISQCLGYGLFREAGLPASRCNFAHVTVNGEDLGVYSNVETIKDSFLRRNFGDDSGNLYESGGEFVTGATGGFQPKNAAADCSELTAVADALAAPDNQLVSEFGAVVDLDAFLRFWAMEVITDHWDGMGNNLNNYFFYVDPTTDRLQFIPWGIDALFTGRQRTTRPDSVYACGSMQWRLYDAPATRAMYLDTLRDLLDTVWDEDAILDEIDRMEELLLPLEPTLDLGGTRAFVSARKAALLAELDAGEPVWPYPQGEQSCRIVIGTMSASWSTTWDTLGTFGVGSGTMGGTIAGTDLTSSTVYASAGYEENGKPLIQLFGELSNGDYAVVFVIAEDPSSYVPGTHAIDLANIAALMTFYDPDTDTATGGGLLLPGSVTFTATSTTAGQPVSGSLTGDVIEL